MALCIPSPTLTLFSTGTSTTIVTTSTVTVQTLPGTTSCLSSVAAGCAASTVIPGGVSSVTVPVIITSIVTVVNPTSTLYASCSATPTSAGSQSTSTSTSQSPSAPQYTPTTVVITSTPPPTVVTQEQSTTLDNGAVTVVTIISTSTPPTSVVLIPTSVTASASQSQASKSSSSAVAPIAAGAAGGFVFLICVVAMIWFILKKCRKPNADREEEDDIVFPYPVTRDREQTRRLDLSHESRPYEYGIVGRSTPDTGSPALVSHDGRRDSATALIGTSSMGSIPMASAPSIQSRGGDVGRQASRSSNPLLLPPGAAPPRDYHSSDGGSASGSSTTPGTSSRRPLQVINPPYRRDPFNLVRLPGLCQVPVWWHLSLKGHRRGQRNNRLRFFHRHLVLTPDRLYQALVVSQRTSPSPNLNRQLGSQPRRPPHT
ncbi:hypothetical protein BJV74DRAFT_4577 [Russula compacta]|nr:hypothetical protein BJV74DRAFT_4577 [Russula compacta]